MSEPYREASGLVRVYPAREPNGTGLVWAHGGAFAFGDIDMPEADWVAAQLAARGTTVVSVDYRLSPLPAWEGSDAHDVPASRDDRRSRLPYPAACDDVLDAWSWTLANADRLRIDGGRLAIGGASAGGNLAAGATLRLIERHAALPALVLLAYPTLHAVQPAPGDSLRGALEADPDRGRFRADAILAMYEAYLGGSVDDAPLGAVPGLAGPDDLALFPPTLMVNGDVDELRASGEGFAAALQAAGREVDVSIEAGTDHGHLDRPHEAAASLTLDRFAARLAALSLPTSSPSPTSSPAPLTSPARLSQPVDSPGSS